MREIINENLSKDLTVNFPTGKEPSRAKVNNFGNKTKMIAGTYSNSTKRSYRTGNDRVADGIFWQRVENNRQLYVKCVPYSSIKSMKLSNSTSKSGSKRAARFAQASAPYQMNFHNFLQRENETLLFGEVYYPHYHTETVTTWSNGRATTRTVTVFDGYMWKGGIILCIDEKGNLKWDNGFTLKTSPLSMNTSLKFRFVELEDGGIKVVYNEGDQFKSKVFYDGRNADDAATFKIDYAQKRKVKAQDLESSGVEYWYDDIYLAYGYAKIKKQEGQSDKRKKIIFFLNKIDLNNEDN